MLPSFDKLAKMLTQEKKLGYKNKAVMGGLEKLAPNWLADALHDAPHDEARESVQDIEQQLRAYHTIPETERPTYIHKILVRLYKLGEDFPMKGSAPVREAKRRERSDALVTTNVEITPAPVRPAKKRQHTPPPEAPTPTVKAEVAPTPKAAPATRPVTKSNRPVSGNVTMPAAAPYMPDHSGDEFNNMGLDSLITRLPGIKEAMAKKLANLNIFTVGDFLNLQPRRYDDYRALKPINRLSYGEEVTIIAQVWDVRKRDLSNNRSMTIANLSDGTAMIEVNWFNQPWLVNQLKTGTQIVVSGKVSEYLGKLNFQSPDWEELDKELVHTGRIVPVYPLTSGITAKWLRTQIKRTVDYWAARLADPLPADMIERAELLPLSEATRQVHFPDDWEKLEGARRRLAFDELLLIQLAVLRQRQQWQTQYSQPITINPDFLAQVIQAIPFELTGAQQRVIKEIVTDLSHTQPMNRLLQGDVGAGKTVVALIAMVLAVLDEGQAAMLAPTEILAEQHFRGMQKLLGLMSELLGRPFEMRLLTGSSSAAERELLAQGLESGQIHLLVGTHAIIQEHVQFQRLRLAVIDEQHRFGVEQRAALRRKGNNPHLLVMTATPIPRTLALTVYGDLDVSVIDELPPGRQVIETRWLAPRERERAYNFIRMQTDRGHQAFVICPLVEDSDKLEAKSAVEEHKRLQQTVFPKLKLGLLHGRMRPNDKEDIMRSFRNREIDILVSTSVVEVGIDIPNATVMLVEGANRFGLSQLHQFRGRVGRGEHKSYCLLVADTVSPEAQQRLEAIERTNNGFELAEEDLRLRGPGEFFGTRQSGLPDMKFVKLSDTRLLDVARREAQFMLNESPTLELPKYQPLWHRLNNFWNARSDTNQ